MTGREVIERRRKGTATRPGTIDAAATMETWDKGSVARTRELDVTEQTTRAASIGRSSFHGAGDVQNTLFLHLSPRDERIRVGWTPATRRTRRLGEAERDRTSSGRI